MQCHQSWDCIWPDKQGPKGLLSHQRAQSYHVSLSFSVWVQGRGEWADMTLNALCKSQHESQAFMCRERTDCVPSHWNARRSLSGAVLADIVLLDRARSGRTRTESKPPSLYFCGPVILLLFFVQIINRNPIHSEFFNPVFSIGCCYFESASLPFWLLGRRRFSKCAQNDMIEDPAEQGPVETQGAFQSVVWRSLRWESKKPCNK